MRRFVVFSLLTIGLFVLATVTTVFAGRLQAAPLPVAMLRLSYCAIPCWIGIVPGKTTADEARTRIKAMYGNSPEFELSITWADVTGILPVIVVPKGATQRSIWIGLHVRGDGIVDSIVFSFANADQPITLADLHTLLGPPSYMMPPNMMLDRIDDLVLTYGDDDRGAKVYATAQLPIHWTQTVHSLILYSRDRISLLPTRRLPWRGFRALPTYYVAAR
jgi:hypothetical protein